MEAPKLSEVLARHKEYEEKAKLYCVCKNSSGLSTGYEDEFGYWDVCADCGLKIEDGHHYYNYFDGEDHLT